jgi:hypothetical protein
MAMKHKDEDLQSAVDLLYRYGTTYHAERESGVPAATLRDRNRIGLKKGFKPQVSKVESELQALKRQVKELKKHVVMIEKESLDAKMIKDRIMKIGALEADPPSWILKAPKKHDHLPGIPSLFCSDWHFGEYVDPDQIAGKNSYSVKIAKARIRRLVENTVNLLKNHLTDPVYPGIVLILGGDMTSGDIHEELSETNEISGLQTVVELYDCLSWMVDTLLLHFPKVFVPAVTGNHGRLTRKPRNKNRVYTNLDWLIACLLQKRYKNDKRVSFLISDGSDAYFKIYNHRYLLSHGDQFRGGDGMIGSLGPIIRGDHRKRTRQGQIDQPYDTLLLGHFHQLMQMSRVIVNGSLKGYDCYAWANNFSFEHPQQALWLTHPTRGITISMPVHLHEEKHRGKPTNWVSIPE